MFFIQIFLNSKLKYILIFDSMHQIWPYNFPAFLFEKYEKTIASFGVRTENLLFFFDLGTQTAGAQPVGLRRPPAVFNTYSLFSFKRSKLIKFYIFFSLSK